MFYYEIVSAKKETKEESTFTLIGPLKGIHTIEGNTDVLLPYGYVQIIGKTVQIFKRTEIVASIVRLFHPEEL